MIAIMSESIVTLLSRLPSRSRQVAAGATLFRRDDPVTQVFLVHRGLIHLVRLTEQGSPVVMQRAGEGMFLAEASIFGDRYHCDAVAVEDTELLAVARADVLAAMTDPGAAQALARHLAAEVMRMRSRAELLSLRTVGERLDAWLALNDGRVPARGRQRHLAEVIGVTPEALYRELARRRASAG